MLVTHAPTYMVVFSREAETDADFVSMRAANPDVSIETAAMQQLAAELESGGACMVAMPVIEALREGDAQCFDFGMGAMELMAAWEPDPKPSA